MLELVHQHDMWMAPSYPGATNVTARQFGAPRSLVACPGLLTFTLRQPQYCYYSCTRNDGRDYRRAGT